MQTNSYLEYLDEDFTMVNKVFKAKLIQGIYKKLKANIKGKNVNMPGVTKALKAIPVVRQDRINIFMDKYVPNYKQNFMIAKRHFDKKYPTEQNTEALAGMTAAITPLDKKKTVQDQIKRTERLYSTLGTSSAGGGIVIFFVGLSVAMAAWSLPEMFESITKQGLAVLVGILLMIAGVKATLS